MTQIKSLNITYSRTKLTTTVNGITLDTRVPAQFPIDHDILALLVSNGTCRSFLYGETADNPRDRLIRHFEMEFGIEAYPSLCKKAHNFWILPIQHLVDCVEEVSSPHGATGVCNDLIVYLIHHRLDIVQQAYDDGSRGLLWLNIGLGLSNSQLRKLLGKSAWGKLRNLSTEESVKLANVLLPFISYSSNSWAAHTFCNTVEKEASSNERFAAVSRSKRCQSVIAHALKLVIGFNQSSLDLLNGKCWTTAVPAVRYMNHVWDSVLALDSIENAFTDVRDTQRMCAQENVAFNNRWSYRRCLRVHDSLAKKIATRSHSDTPIKWLVALSENLEEVSRLSPYWIPTSAADVASVGMRQHHCVGSYIPTVTEGNYFVLCFGTQSKINATAGFNVGHDNQWKLNQIKGIRNRRISIEDYSDDIALIVEILNLYCSSSERAT